MNNEQFNLLMEEIEANFSEISNTTKNTRKKKKELEEEENNKIKQISDHMNNILSNDYQTTTDSIIINTESEVDKMFRKNMMIQERIIAVEMLLKMYPQLEKDKKIIIDKILCTSEQKIELYVLEKIKVNDKDFYKDSSGYIIDSNINVVGVCVFDKNPKYVIFENTNIFIDIESKGMEIINKLDNVFNLNDA